MAFRLSKKSFYRNYRIICHSERSEESHKRSTTKASHSCNAQNFLPSSGEILVAAPRADKTPHCGVLLNRSRILNERSEVKNLGCERMLNGAESVEDSAPLLAFCQFELYRTFVRRRIQIDKIYSHWIAIRTRPKQEKRAVFCVVEFGIRQYCQTLPP